MRARAMIGMALAGAALAGCAHLPFGPHAMPRGGETISYAAGPCYGTCPVYSITLGPDGQGIFTGERHTAATGDHRFTATPEQVRAFGERLREYRPNGEVLMTGAPFCKTVATDQGTVDVRWHGSDGAPRHLAFNGGCDVEKNRKMANALFSAPTLLPITDLIGPAVAPR